MPNGSRHVPCARPVASRKSAAVSSSQCPERLLCVDGCVGVGAAAGACAHTMEAQNALMENSSVLCTDSSSMGGPRAITLRARGNSCQGRAWTRARAERHTGAAALAILARNDEGESHVSPEGARDSRRRCCSNPGVCPAMTHSHHAAHEHPHPSPPERLGSTAPPHGAHGTPGGRHAGHAVAQFERRFWISLALTVPIVLLSPMIQHWLGLGERLRFPGDQYIAFALATAVYFYGGWPFLTGLVGELKHKQPGMMTLVALAITTAYVYSTLVVLGLSGEGFFWELATLVDIMLLGHWVEMRSVMGASGALEALVRLLPAEAHRRRADGTVEDVPVSVLTRGDRVIVKPGERIPTDGVVVEGRTTVNQALLPGESQPVARGAD